MESNTKVVIMCGGLGTRLREETEFKPKPMVLVGGMPILWHIMKIYSHFGFRDFVLCLGYRGDYIKQHFLNQELMNQDFTISLRDGKKTVHDGASAMEDWNITFAETGLNAMTGARVKRIERYVDSDRFMLTYGDGVADIDVKKLLEFHQAKKTIGTLTGVNPQSRFGLIKSTQDGFVNGFVEKPVLRDDFVNVGFYVFRKDIFDYLQDGDSCVLETEPLNRLVKEKQLSMYKHNSFWQCMDTYRDYLELNRIWDSGKVPWKVWK